MRRELHYNLFFFDEFKSFENDCYSSAWKTVENGDNDEKGECEMEGI